MTIQMSKMTLCTMMNGHEPMLFVTLSASRCPNVRVLLGCRFRARGTGEPLQHGMQNTTLFLGEMAPRVSERGSL